MSDESDSKGTTESYYGIQGAYQQGKLTLLQWQTYELLWHHAPLEQKALNEMAKTAYGDKPRPMWAAQLKKLKAFGLVEERNKQWAVTKAISPVEVSVAKKPNRKKFAKAIEDIDMALARAEYIGLASPEAQMLLGWLRTKV